MQVTLRDKFKGSHFLEQSIEHGLDAYVGPQKQQQVVHVLGVNVLHFLHGIHLKRQPA